VEREHFFAARAVQLSILGIEGWTETTRVVRSVPTRVQLRTMKAAPVGAAVRIDAEDALVLGEVRDCAAEPDGFYLSIELMQIIPSVMDLQKLVSAIMAEGAMPHTGERRARPHTRQAAMSEANASVY
jgi:hypothetical protein